jgi:hypothetical protein
MLAEVTPDDQHRQRLRQRGRRIVIPVACVFMMLRAILAIAAFSYQQNRRDALVLSDDLLRELQRRIATEVKGYLAPAADMARLAAGVLQSQAFGTAFPVLTEVLAMHVLENYPQLVTVNIADTKGNFLMPKRMPDGSIHTRRIERTGAATPKARSLRWNTLKTTTTIRGGVPGIAAPSAAGSCTGAISISFSPTRSRG